MIAMLCNNIISLIQNTKFDRRIKMKNTNNYVFMHILC